MLQCAMCIDMDCYISSLINYFLAINTHFRWGHLVKDGHCVDRFILHVWDTKANLMRYIYNSNLTRSASVSVARCTKLYVKVEIQEDDLQGYPPDSVFTSVAEAALTSKWLHDPFINTNRSEVTIDRTFSHWSQVHSVL